MTGIFRTASLGLAGLLVVCATLSAQSAIPPSNSALNGDTISSVNKVEPNPAAATSDSSNAGAASSPPDTSSAKVAPEPAAPAGPKDKPDDTYIVGIADELQISVWKEPDLSGPVVVRPDGMITVPVVNDVHVVGLTTKQVQDILTDKLKDVVAEPQVTVIVRNIKSRKVYLMGQVGRPGAVSLNGHETALQVIAESGGVGMYAKTDKIYILRKVDGREEKLPFHYKKAVKGNDPNADFQLVNGDVIVVP